MPRKPSEKCYNCGSKTPTHSKCEWCKVHGKCWMCAFYDKDELSAEARKHNDIGPWRINRAKCAKCGDVITSNNRHDFKYCKCKQIAVDGGSWYLRRLFHDEGDIIEMSESYASAANDE